MGSRISIVVPSYNQAAYLDEALASLCAQAYPDLELIVMDGGSTDGSPAVIRKYEDRIAYWQSRPDGGQAAALAEGFRRATGDILGWLNSDDLLLPGALRRVGEHFESHPETMWLYGNSHVVDENGQLIWRRVVPAVTGYHLLNLTVHLPQESTFFRRSLYKRTEGVDPSLHFAMDYDLWLKLLDLAHPVHLDDFLGCFRLVAGQKSSHLSDYQAEERQVKDRLGYGPASRGVMALARIDYWRRSIPARVRAEGFRGVFSLATNQVRVLGGAPEARGGSKRLAVGALGAAAVCSVVAAVWVSRVLGRRV